MKADVKEAWLAALRSGNYKQTKGRLRDQEGYCCLGVLCDIAVKQEVIPEPVVGNSGTYIYTDGVGGPGWTGGLPFLVVEWAGVEDEDPTVENFLLSDWNDGKGKNFAEIADLIEEHL